MSEDNDGDPVPTLAKQGKEDIDEDLLPDVAERKKCLGLQIFKAATKKSYSSHWKQHEIFCETNGVPNTSLVKD